jgi:restriction endonuclease S subunit
MLSKEAIPEHWELQTLSELVDEKAEFIEDGDWIESDDMDESGELGIVQLGQIEKNQLKFEEISRYITREWAKDNNCTIAKPQDLIIPRMSPVLGAAEVPDDSPDFVVPVDAMILRGLNDSFRTFLKYYLNSHFSDLFADKMSTGATRSRISQSDARKLPIPVPPLEEQEMIVEKLDEIFDSIEEIQDAQDDAEDKYDIAFNSGLRKFIPSRDSDVEKIRFGDTGEIYGGGTPTRSRDEYWNGSIPWVSAKDMGKRKISDSQDHMTEEAFEQSSAA